MSILDTLFGGSEGSSTQQQKVWGPQEGYLKDIMSQGQGLYNQYSQDPSQIVAGFTPDQMQGFDMARQSAGNVGQFANNALNTLQGNFNQQAPTYNGAMPAINQMMSGNVNLEPYNQMADAITGRMTRNFTESVLPSISRANFANNPHGSSRAGIAAGIATDRLQQNMGDTLSNLYGSAFENAQNRMGQGVNAYQNMDRLNEGARQFNAGNALNSMAVGSQVGNMAMMPANTYQQIGAAQQGLNQQQLDAPFSLLGRYQQAVGNPLVLGSTNQSNSSFNGTFSPIQL